MNHLHSLLAFLVLVCDGQPFFDDDVCRTKVDKAIDKDTDMKEAEGGYDSTPKAAGSSSGGNFEVGSSSAETTKDATSPSATRAKKELKKSHSNTEKYYGQLSMPQEVRRLLYEKEDGCGLRLAGSYIAEAVLLFRENSNSLVFDMLTGISYCNKDSFKL